MEQSQADAVILECIALVLDTVAEVLPHYVEAAVAAQVVATVRAVVKQEFAALLEED